MGLMQRRKGKNFERAVALAFRALFPEARRTLTQARDSGEAPDVHAPGFWVEAKNHRRVNIQKAFAQAVDEAERAASTDIPVAVTKDLRKEPLATLRLTDFLQILSGMAGNVPPLRKVGAVDGEVARQAQNRTIDTPEALESKMAIRPLVPVTDRIECGPRDPAEWAERNPDLDVR